MTNQKQPGYPVTMLLSYSVTQLLGKYDIMINRTCFALFFLLLMFQMQTIHGQGRVGYVDLVDVLCHHPQMGHLSPNSLRFDNDDSRFRSIDDINKEIKSIKKEQAMVTQKIQSLKGSFANRLKFQRRNVVNATSRGLATLQKGYFKEHHELIAENRRLGARITELEILTGFRGLTGNDTIVTGVNEITETVLKAIRLAAKKNGVAHVFEKSMLQVRFGENSQIVVNNKQFHMFDQPYHKFLKRGDQKISSSQDLKRWMSGFQGFDNLKFSPLLMGGVDITSDSLRALSYLLKRENKK